MYSIFAKYCIYYVVISSRYFYYARMQLQFSIVDQYALKSLLLLNRKARESAVYLYV